MTDLPDIERAWSVQPGDRIIVEFPDNIPAAEFERVLSNLDIKSRWPDVDFLFLAGGARVAAVVPKEKQDLIDLAQRIDLGNEF